MTRRTKIGLIVVTVIGATVVGLVDFTEMCRLEAVTLNGQPVEQWSEQFQVLQPRSIARQSLDSLARVILADDDVFQVDVDISGIHTLSVRTNEFTPECLLLDRKTGELRGLDNRARVLPLDNATVDWERPILTGLTAGPMFEPCRQAGVRTVTEELRKLRDSNEDIYRLIEEVRFEPDGSLTVQIAGLGYCLRLTPERFRRGIDQYLAFVTRFESDLEGVALLDVRYDNMVVTRGGK